MPNGSRVPWTTSHWHLDGVELVEAVGRGRAPLAAAGAAGTRGRGRPRRPPRPPSGRRPVRRTSALRRRARARRAACRGGNRRPQPCRVELVRGRRGASARDAVGAARRARRRSRSPCPRPRPPRGRARGRRRPLRGRGRAPDASAASRRWTAAGPCGVSTSVRVDVCSCSSAVARTAATLRVACADQLGQDPEPLDEREERRAERRALDLGAHEPPSRSARGGSARSRAPAGSRDPARSSRGQLRGEHVVDRGDEQRQRRDLEVESPGRSARRRRGPPAGSKIRSTRMSPSHAFRSQPSGGRSGRMPTSISASSALRVRLARGSPRRGRSAGRLGPRGEAAAEQERTSGVAQSRGALLHRIDVFGKLSLGV